MKSVFKKYIDRVGTEMDFSDIECFEYLDALFPGFQSTGIYRSYALEEERGSLSWGAALLGRAYLRLYEYTQNEKYLRAFVGIAEQILLARDSVRGVTDYRHKSAPVWRSGRPYTTSTISFSCGKYGAPCLEIRSKQASHLRIVDVDTATGRFDVSFHWGVDGEDSILFSDVSLVSSDIRCLSKVLNEQEWKSPQAAAVIAHSGCVHCLPEPGSYAMHEQYYAPAVHVSQICVSLLEFARIVHQDADLTDTYGSYSKRYIEAATLAMDAYESDYRMAGDAGHYVIPRDAPNDFEGTDAPLNHNMSMALCFLLLYRVTKNIFFETRARQLLATFRASLTEIEHNGSKCLIWPYFSPGMVNYGGYKDGGHTRWRTTRRGNTRMEDMSHAVISVEAAIEAFSLGIEFTSRDLEQMANTFVAAATTGSLANYLDGSAGYGKYDNIAGRWAILAPWGGSVYQTALDVMNATQPQPVHASVLLACAILLRSKS